MPDDSYWDNTQRELAILVDRLQPDDALEIIKKLVREGSDQHMAPALASMIRGYIARRDNEREDQDLSA